MAHQLSPGPGFLGQELDVPEDVSLVLLPLTFIPPNQQEWAAARTAGARNAFFPNQNVAGKKTAGPCDPASG